MRIAFYAPMKAPDHPVPSGDRQMARLLTAALARAGHQVDLVSNLRSFLAQPDPAADAANAQAAAAEVERIAAGWRAGGTPDLVFAYHLHYKAPDRVALPLARRFGLPYLTAEASYARRRADGPWGGRQDQVAEAVRHAALNLCFTANDRAGLAEIVGQGRLVDLPPFIDTARFPLRERGPDNAVPEIVTVAMMRPGDKLDSYRFLATALARLDHLDWRLTVVGDGPAETEVQAALAALPPGRVRRRGVQPAQAVAAALAAADLFAWPGFNEAFGLCYLEAAATGLPSLAVHGEGTPSVILHGETGLLTPPDPDAYAEALARLLADRPGRESMGRAAARFVHGTRGLPQAATRLDAAVRRAVTARKADPIRPQDWLQSRPPEAPMAKDASASLVPHPASIGTPSGPAQDEGRRAEAGWAALDAALDRAARAGRPVRFWLRDDDAVEVTPALRRLARLCDGAGLPVLLAVIPAGVTPALADWLAEQRCLTPCQHGWAHANHAAPGQRARELGGARSDAAVLAELRTGRERLRAWVGKGGLSDILVPPWNRIRDSLLPELAALGFGALSTFAAGRGAAPAPLPRLDCDLDIIDWRNGRRGRPIADLCARLVPLVEAAAVTGRAIGVLTHHLAHDEAAWAFLEGFLARAAGDGRIAFTSAAVELARPA